MGYTHYFDQTSLTEEVFEDCKKIVKNSPVELAGWDGTKKPVVKHNEIAFNGVGDESCETFRLEDHPAFDFCKTGELPYDVVVVACLVSVIVHDAGDVSSDGVYSEWSDGIKLYESVCGKISPENRKKIRKALK